MLHNQSLSRITAAHPKKAPTGQDPTRNATGELCRLHNWKHCTAGALMSAEESDTASNRGAGAHSLTRESFAFGIVPLKRYGKTAQGKPAAS